MPSQRPQSADEPPRVPPSDCYFENGLIVYTAAYHLNRGQCCGSGCRHCPYEPRHTKGSERVSKAVLTIQDGDGDRGR
ncbi:MAG: hypothetical protein EBR28_04740 [Planctomycetia bacterium]|nr:hypothetical protein [Planctomycetia bacterium]